MTQEANLRAIALSFDAATVDSCIAKIDACIDKRDSESNNGGLSWFASRKLINKNKIAFARFLLSLNVEPANVILDSKNSASYFNAKALKKIVEFAQFVVNKCHDIETVSSAFIICALRFHAMNDGAPIVNEFNRAFLSGFSFANIVKDDDLAAELAKYQHKVMSGGAPTQSSQARRVLEVLNLATISSNRKEITLKTDHAFFDLFCDELLKA